MSNNKLKIIDLCGRLPYGVCCLIVRDNSTEVVRVSSVETDTGAVVLHGDIYPVYHDDWIAYLRPLDSMTKEESEELANTANNSPVSCVVVNITRDIIAVDYTMCDAIITWLNAHHFDYRGLIEQGLALEAPEGMYNINNSKL